MLIGASGSVEYDAFTVSHPDATTSFTSETENERGPHCYLPTIATTLSVCTSGTNVTSNSLLTNLLSSPVIVIDSPADVLYQGNYTLSSLTMEELGHVATACPYADA
ncbi:MAG TPA: hypothetical protein VH621_06515, partial [Nitrososphaera sp.]